MKTLPKAALALVGLLAIASTAHALGSFGIFERFDTTENVCSDGTAQDYTCLDANGAIGPDGSIDDNKAKQLASSGACPCADGSGGTSTSTIPADANDAQVNHPRPEGLIVTQNN